MTLPIILASTSPYRKKLLAKLEVAFTTCSPNIDETPYPNESAQELVMRLAKQKAQAGAKGHDNALVIGADQVAVIDGTIIGKPLTKENAIRQLTLLSGKKITFYTGIAVYNSAQNKSEVRYQPFIVHFRTLTKAQINYYIDKEQPLFCAGSFKAEGFGIALFNRLEGHDPNTLIGLPLIALTQMLLNQGVDILSPPL